MKEAEDKLILSLCKEKDFGIVGVSDEQLIQKFREVYRDHLDLLTKATLGDNKALKHLRWILGLKEGQQNLTRPECIVDSGLGVSFLSMTLVMKQTGP